MRKGNVPCTNKVYFYRKKTNKSKVQSLSIYSMDQEKYQKILNDNKGARRYFPDTWTEAQQMLKEMDQQEVEQPLAKYDQGALVQFQIIMKKLRPHLLPDPFSKEKEKTSPTNFCGKLVPDRYAAFRPELTSLTKLLNQVKAHELKEEKEQLSRIADFSMNYLADEDIKIVIEIVENVGFCNIIILRNNQLTTCYNDIKGFLAKNIIRYVDITINPIASIDHREAFFKKITKLEFEKLIWIPNSFLEGGSWKDMVSEEHLQTIINTHVSFYKILESFQEK